MKIIAIAWNFLKLEGMNKTTYIVLLMMPLLIILLLGTALSQVFQPKEEEWPSLRIAVVNQDAGQIGEHFQYYLDQMQEAGRLTWSLHEGGGVSHEEVEAGLKNLLKQGEADYAVMIPGDFSMLVFAGEQASWSLYPGNHELRNESGEFAVRLFMDRVRDSQAAAVAAGPQTFEWNEDGNDDFGNGTARVRVGAIAEGVPSLTAMQYYGASMLVMFILYAGMISAIHMVQEKEQYTWMRIMAAPVTGLQLITGKALGGLMMSLLQTAAILLVTAWLFGLDWGADPWLLMLVLILVMFIANGLAITVMRFARTEKTVASIFQVLIIVMTFLSGGFLPDLDSVVETAGKLTVNYWAVKGIHELILGGESPAVWQSVGVLAWIAAGIFAIALLSFWRKEGRHE